MIALLGTDQLTRMRLVAAARGVWVADECTTAEGAALTGAATLTVGERKLSGTVDPHRSGAAVGRSVTRLVGGGGAWGNTLPSRTYQSDAGIRLRTILEDAAEAAGEKLGRCPDISVGTYYIRIGSGVSVLDYAAELGECGWYTDWDGVTHIEARPASKASSDITVLEWDAESRWLSLDADSLDQVPLGGTIPTNEITGQELTIAALELVVGAAAITLRVWCPPVGTVHSPLANALKALFKFFNASLMGVYRYQVAYLEGDRLALQPVKKRTDIPPITKVRMAPGVAGVFCTVTPGCEIYVMFVDGDRNDPIAMGFGTKDSNGFKPASISIGGGTTPVAKLGSIVNVYLPPGGVVAGSLSGAPFTGTLTLLAPMQGQITDGCNPEVLV